LTYKFEKQKDTHSILKNPKFIDAKNHNFRLSSNSPCINAASNIGLSTDYDGHSTPQGLRSDIGAFEYYMGAPKNLRFN
jgi:hypothetical protein